MTSTRPHSLALLIASVVPALTVIWTVDVFTPVIVGTGVVVTLALSVERFRVPWWRIAVITAVAALMSLTSFLYARPEGSVYAHWGLVTISDGSFVVALAAFTRILAIAIPAALIATQIEPHEFIATTVVRRVVPQRAALASLIALRLVPVIISDLAETRVARRAAGLSTRFASLVVTTLVIAIRRAIRMSEIAEVRGFSQPDRVWTAYRRFTSRDWGLLIAVTSSGVAALAITALTGEWNSAI
jgi:energy-coupling factor transporter transmembrane protein EcfT